MPHVHESVTSDYNGDSFNPLDGWRKLCLTCSAWSHYLEHWCIISNWLGWGVMAASHGWLGWGVMATSLCWLAGWDGKPLQHHLAWWLAVDSWQHHSSSCHGSSTEQAGRQERLGLHITANQCRLNVDLTIRNQLKWNLNRNEII